MISCTRMFFLFLFYKHGDSAAVFLRLIQNLQYRRYKDKLHLVFAPLISLLSFSPVGHLFIILHLFVSMWDGHSDAAFSSGNLLDCPPPRILVCLPHLKPQVTPSRRQTLQSLHSPNGPRTQSSNREED